MHEISLEYLVLLETLLLFAGFISVLLAFMGWKKSLMASYLACFMLSYSAWGITNALFSFGILTTLCTLIYRETNLAYKTSHNSNEKVMHDKIRLGLWIGLISFVLITLTFKTFTGSSLLY